MADKTNPDDHGRSRGRTDWAAVDALSDEDVAATADPDAPTSGPPMRPMAEAKRIRLKLQLGQEAFAERFHIPLSTLIAWERHEAEPDQVAQAFLAAIAADPDAVGTALARGSKRPAGAE